MYNFFCMQSDDQDKNKKKRNKAAGGTKVKHYKYGRCIDSYRSFLILGRFYNSYNQASTSC